ncbi:MAG: hypothetical protein H0T73_10615 [Ardenticatenales bacterium]|nr:hypothetical protein [Ardenticatenales bacterium]
MSNLTTFLKVLVVVLLAGVALLPPVSVAPPVAEGQRFGPASLDVQDGWVRLTVEGNPYEMGLQQGVLLRPELRDLIAGSLYPSLLASNISVQDARRYARLVWPRLPLPLREEMQGIAEGAALSLEDVLLWNLRADLLALGPDLPDVLRDFALLREPQQPLTVERQSALVRALPEERQPWPSPLSPLWSGSSPSLTQTGTLALALWGEATHEGQPWLGAVLAAPPGGERFMLVLRRPTEGSAIMGLALPGQVGLQAGQNAAGLTLLLTPFQSIDRAFDGLPAALLVRQTLGQAQGREEAVTFLLNAPRSGGSSLLVADAAGDEVTRLDLSARQFHPVPAEGDTLLALGAPLEGPLSASTQPLRLPEGPQRGRLATWLRANQGVASRAGLQALLSEPLVVGERGAVTLLLSPTDTTFWLAQAAEGHPAPASGWIELDLGEWLQND